MLHFFAMLSGGVAAASGPGPTGPPTSPFTSEHGSPAKYRIHWSNGDATAYTRIYQNSSVPVNLLGTENPGRTSFNSALLVSGDPYNLILTHFKNGQESADTPLTADDEEEA